MKTLEQDAKARGRKTQVARERFYRRNVPVYLGLQWHRAQNLGDQAETALRNVRANIEMDRPKASAYWAREAYKLAVMAARGARKAVPALREESL